MSSNSYAMLECCSLNDKSSVGNGNDAMAANGTYHECVYCSVAQNITYSLTALMTMMCACIEICTSVVVIKVQCIRILCKSGREAIYVYRESTLLTQHKKHAVLTCIGCLFTQCCLQCCI